VDKVTVTCALSAAAAERRSMEDEEKGPWIELGVESIRQYHAQKAARGHDDSADHEAGAPTSESVKKSSKGVKVRARKTAFP